MLEAFRDRLQRAEQSERPIIQQTTLQDCGIGTSKDAHLNLAGEPVTLGTLPRKSSGQVHVALLHHPFAGAHLARLLEGIIYDTTNPSAAIHGALGDWQMPDDARRKLPELKALHAAGIVKDEDIRLYNLHRRDPDIGKAFVEFDKHHRPQWQKALTNDAANGLFATVEGGAGFMVINSDEFVSANREEFEQLPGLWGRAFEYGDGVPMLRFLQSLPEVKEKVAALLARRAQRDLTDPGLYRPLFYESPFKEMNEGYVGIGKMFAPHMPEEDRKRMYLAFGAVKKHAFLIDTDHATIWMPWFAKDRGLSASLEDSVSGERVKISDNNGNSCIVQVSPDGSREDWHITEYNFSGGYLSQAIYPLLVWEEREGQRRFLSQKEIQAVAKKQNIPVPQAADVILGRVIAAYFSPEVTKGWRKHMPLKDGRYEQTMMAAQTPVWVSMPEHSEGLLAEENAIFPALEKKVT